MRAVRGHSGTCLSLHEWHKSHWVDVEFVDGEMKGLHTYALGSNVTKRRRAANIAAAMTVALEFGLKPTEYSGAKYFNYIMKDISTYMKHNISDSEFVLRASGDAV